MSEDKMIGEAEQVAARVPLPEPVAATYRENLRDGSLPESWAICGANFADPRICVNMHTADQLRAYGLACVREAMRGWVAGSDVGEMDRTAPPEVWLQIDTEGDSEDRSEAIPRESWDHISWYYESMGGQEVRYIRADLVAAPPAGRVEVSEVEVGLHALSAWASGQPGDDNEFARGYAAARMHVQEIIRQHPSLTAALQEPK